MVAMPLARKGWWSLAGAEIVDEELTIAESRIAED
jgi:hypothetical protein